MDPGRIPFDEPLAYLLTWPTYGTWLPGDDRGWVQHGKGFQLPDPVRRLEAAARMADDACRLGDSQRALVEATIAAHCSVRTWTMHAVNCRSNHVHVVVTADKHPDTVCDQFKAWCTRKLKEQQLSARPDSREREKWWAARCSKRYINDETSLESAILYVRDAQEGSRYV
jgi:REP element-mobilizing transposase RayT